MTGFQKSDSDKNIEIIKKIYSGISNNDFDSVMNLFDSNVIRNEPEQLTGGTYRGHFELRNHLLSGRSQWAEGACQPVEFFPTDDKIVVIIQIKVRLKNNSTWIDAQLADGFKIKSGLVTEFHTFANKQTAFNWLGHP